MNALGDRGNFFSSIPLEVLGARANDARCDVVHGTAQLLVGPNVRAMTRANT